MLLVLWTNYSFKKCQTCRVPIYKPVLQDGLNGAPCFVIPVSFSSDLFLKGWTLLCGVWRFYTGGTVQCFSLVDFVYVFKSDSLDILKHLRLHNPQVFGNHNKGIFFKSFCTYINFEINSINVFFFFKFRYVLSYLCLELLRISKRFILVYLA